MHAANRRLKATHEVAQLLGSVDQNEDYSTDMVFSYPSPGSRLSQATILPCQLHFGSSMNQALWQTPPSAPAPSAITARVVSGSQKQHLRNTTSGTVGTLASLSCESRVSPGEHRSLGPHTRTISERRYRPDSEIQVHLSQEASPADLTHSHLRALKV